MNDMMRRMFPKMAAAGLIALTASACAVVGYPAPVRGPLTVAVPRSAAAGGVVLAASPVRRYEVLGRSYTTLPTSAGYREVGIASWYGEAFQGRPTASGETFDMHGFTAAHRSLPLPTCVEVKRLDDGRTVTVRVNDRGPFSADSRRIIDLSYSAARELGLILPGTAEVEVQALPADAAC